MTKHKDSWLLTKHKDSNLIVLFDGISMDTKCLSFTTDNVAINTEWLLPLSYSQGHNLCHSKRAFTGIILKRYLLPSC